MSDFTVTNSLGQCESTHGVETAKDAAEDWALDWLDRYGDTETVIVSLDGEKVGTFDVKVEMKAKAKEITT